MPDNLKSGSIFIGENDWWEYLAAVGFSTMFFLATSFIWLLFFVGTGGGLTGEFSNRADESAKLKFVGLFTANTHHIICVFYNYWVLKTACSKGHEFETGSEGQFLWFKDTQCMY